MTDKRFTTDYNDFLKEDMTFIKNNDKRMTFQEVVDLLNELHEENQELHKCLNTIYIISSRESVE